MNPFREGAGSNPYDRPISLHGLASAASDELTVSFDAKTGAGSTAAVALLARIRAMVKTDIKNADEQRRDRMARTMGKFVGQTLEPIEKRLAALEAAIDVQKADVAEAIRATAAAYLGEDQ